MTPFQRAYFWGFTGALIACFSPSKELAYIAPAAIVAAVYIASPSTRNSIASRILLVLLSWTTYATVHILINQSLVLQSAVLVLVTYGTVLLAFILPSRALASEALFRAMLSVAAATVTVQAAIGTVQAISGYVTQGTFDGGTGDVVEGTIHLALGPSGSFANPMFAISMTLLLLGLLSRMGQPRRLAAPVAWGGLVVILASVVHGLVFIAIASVVAFLITYGGRRRIPVIPVIVLALLGGLALTMLPGNFRDTGNYWDLLSSAQLPKTAVAVTATTEMPAVYPHMPLIGLGPGQFSSRAAVIMTGDYAQGGTVPLLTSATPEASRRYLMGPLRASWRGHHFGSTGQPLSSYLSVYTEFGLLFLAGVAAYLVHLLRLARRAASDGRYRVEAWVFATGCLFLFLLGVQENYWEVTQAILPGAMLLKVLHGLLLPRAPVSCARDALWRASRQAPGRSMLGMGETPTM